MALVLVFFDLETEADEEEEVFLKMDSLEKEVTRKAAAISENRVKRMLV